MHDPDAEARRRLRASRDDLACARHVASGGFHAASIELAARIVDAAAPLVG